MESRQGMQADTESSVFKERNSPSEVNGIS